MEGMGEERSQMLNKRTSERNKKGKQYRKESKEDEDRDARDTAKK